MRRTVQVRSVGLLAGGAVALASTLVIGVGSALPAQAAAAAGTAKAAVSTAPTLLPGTFVSLPPTRVMDTSTGTGTPKQPVGPGGVIKVAVLGHGGLPTSGVAAVVLNVTAASATANGYLTAYSDAASRPTTSTLTFAAGASVSNLTFLKISAGGVVDLYNGSAGTVQVSADVHGYFVAGTPTVPGAYVALAPQRVFDTSNGTNTATGPIAARGKAVLKLLGVGGLPTKRLETVTLNVTASGATAAGSLAVGHVAGPAINSFTTGRTSSVLVTLHTGPNGSVGLYNNSSGPVQVAADVEGYTLAGPASPGATLFPADTVFGDNQPGAYTPSDASGSLSANPITVAGHGTAQVDLTQGSYPSGVGTVALDLTTDGTQSGAGFLTAYATGSTRPATPDVTFAARQAVTGFVLADADRTQHVTVYNSSAGPVTFSIGPVGFFNQQRTPSLSWKGQVVDPPRGSLTDVSCPAPGSCTESDLFGNTIAQTAGGWGHATPLFNFDGKGVQDVSCPTTTFCAAAGDWSVAVEQSGTWSAYVPLAVTVNHALTGLSCASSTFCVVRDNFGWAYTWNGTTWSAPVVADANGLSDLSCPAVGMCFGVDPAGSVAQLSNGAWHVTAHVVAGYANEFNGDQISCPTTAFCEATSSQDAATYSGGVWHTSTPISFAEVTFPAHLSCASATLCMFASSGPSGVEWTTADGHTWTSHPSLLTVNGLDCRGSSCVVVGSTTYDDSSSQQTQVFTGSSWAAPVVSDPYDEGDLVGVSCPTASWCLAEDGGYYLIGKADTWSWPAAFPAGIGVGRNLHCVSQTYCTVDAGHAVATWRGSSWTLGPKVTNSYIAELSCPTTTFCMAVDQTGAAFTFNGSTWKSVAKPGQGTAVLDCASSTFCVAAGLVNTSDEAYRWNGSTWSASAIPNSATYLAQVTCPAVGNCVLLTDDGNVAELSGGTWTLDPALASGQGSGAALSCVGTDTCQLLLGQDELLPVSDGWTGIPQRLFLPGNVRWGAISCPSITTCVATNNMGVAYTGAVP